jgi:hypothetical protein
MNWSVKITVTGMPSNTRSAACCGSCGIPLSNPGINGCRSPAWGPFGVGPAPPPPPKLNVRPSALLSFVNTLPTGLPIGHGIVRCILVTINEPESPPDCEVAPWIQRDSLKTSAYTTNTRETEFDPALPRSVLCLFTIIHTGQQLNNT